MTTRMAGKTMRSMITRIMSMAIMNTTVTESMTIIMTTMTMSITDTTIMKDMIITTDTAIITTMQTTSLIPGDGKRRMCSPERSSSRR